MRNRFLFILAMIMVLTVTACSVKKLSTEKIKDVEFTVVEEKEIPEELLDVIEQRKKEPFKVSFAQGEYLYIAIGYGPQETSGYSIELKECYETENAIYVHPNLIGPSKQEKIIETVTYPYIVIKMEFVDKHEVFE